MSPILRVVSPAVVAAAIAVPANAFACATCSCGDPTLSAVGAETDGSELNLRWSAMGQRQFGEHLPLRGGSEGLFEDEGPKLFAAADAVLSPVTDLVFQLGVRVPFMPANTLNESIAMFATVIDF